MGTVKVIEVEPETASRLTAMAQKRGTTVDALVKQLIDESETVATEAGELAELERRWQDHQTGPAVPHEDVVRWLETWGEPGFKAWSAR